MKTTLDLNDDLLKAAKQRALDTGSSLRQVVETALAQHLKLNRASPSPIKTVIFGLVEKRPRSSDEVTTRTSVNTDKIGVASYDIDSPAYWEKRFGFVPPGLS
jgi:hypothetical protein